jgi:aryl-phospho-beta-D-glucosidase BglC (GH1 family)
MTPRCRLAAACLCFWAPLGCDDSRQLSWLQAEGRRIVDEQGREVRLRGVNLGGWMFHETWITLVGHGPASRAWLEGQKQGIQTEVEAALRQVIGPDPGAFDTCGEGGTAWLDRLESALAAEIEPTRATAFRLHLEGFTSTCDDSELPIRQTLETRFGSPARDELLDAFQGAWIQEADIAWLAGQGFNLVRVPMGYRTLTTSSDLSDPESLALNERALRRIDRLLAWCRAHGVYAVLDLQESPGGHNTYAGQARLYSEERFQDMTVELWLALSARYRDRPEVAAYSLLAEPYGAPDTRARDGMYDLLVKAIRASGDEHLLVIHDGFFYMTSLPDPATYGWDGVIYSTHLFESATSLAGYQGLVRDIYTPVFSQAQDAQQVPYFIGSFSTRIAEDWAYQAAGFLVDWYEDLGWSWALWTYKTMEDELLTRVLGGDHAWGLRGRLGAGLNLDRPDLELDDARTLDRKLAAYRHLALEPNLGLLAELTRTWR